MGKYPYMPLYPGDYFVDTADLTTEEHGFYMLLLMLAWLRDGDIPNDMKWLRNALPASDMHGNRFNKLLPILHRFFKLGPDDFWRNKRISSERDRVEKRSRKGRENSEKRWAPYKKFKELRDANAFDPITIKKERTSEPSTRAAERDIESERGPARGGGSGFKSLSALLAQIPLEPPIK